MSWRKRVSSNGYGSESALPADGENVMKHLSRSRRHRFETPSREKTFTLLLSVAWVITAALSTASAQSPSPILVAYAGQNETVGPMWVGIEKGTFKKYGLDVRLVQLRNGSLSMATLSSGQVQYNYGSPGHWVRAAVWGVKILCVGSPVHKIPPAVVAHTEICYFGAF